MSQQAGVPPPAKAPWYGCQGLAKMAARFMMAKFSQTDYTHPYPVPPQGSCERELGHFIAFALYRGQLPDWLLYGALFLLEKYSQRDPEPLRRSPSMRWLIMAQGRFTHEQLNAFTRDFCSVVGYEFLMRPEALSTFSHRIAAEYS
ncbi:hypothetical protein AURDEDRAFT_172420 [Auricularia subglabra TFB-10046 SS5]|nr:hypothetical protein AURDEDRAFT_172420 [Auricularia subglabra TFB-10046 SS5]